MEQKEIKFRAWDKKNKKMIIPIAICGIGGNINTIFKNDYPNYIWLQFTGLKDKNGKEIYEGDIVKINGYGVKGLLTDIYWEKSLGGFYSRNIYEQDTFEHSQKCIEIIGNLYETPELLTK